MIKMIIGLEVDPAKYFSTSNAAWSAEVRSPHRIYVQDAKIDLQSKDKEGCPMMYLEVLFGVDRVKTIKSLRETYDLLF